MRIYFFIKLPINVAPLFNWLMDLPAYAFKKESLEARNPKERY